MRRWVAQGSRQSDGGLYPQNDEVCWRCDASPATSDVGLCDPCATHLRKETPSPHEPDDGFDPYLDERIALAFVMRAEVTQRLTQPRSFTSITPA